MGYEKVYVAFQLTGTKKTIVLMSIKTVHYMFGRGNIEEIKTSASGVLK